MKGRLRLSFPSPKGEQQKVLEAAMSFFIPKRLKVGRASVFKNEANDEPMFNISMTCPPEVDFQHLKGYSRPMADQMVRAYATQVAKLAYAMEHPEAFLRWIEGEGFRLFSDSGDEEVLFKLGRDGDVS